MRYKSNKSMIYLGLFLLCFIPRVAVNLFVISTPGGHDDLGTLIVPSLLAGYDWSGLIPETSYYGFGYSVIFTPILYFFKNNSYLMFQLIFGVNAFFQALVGLVVYNLLINHYGCKKKSVAFWVSIAMSYLVFTASCKIANDVVLPLITWILLWLLTLLHEKHEDKRKKLLYTLFLVLLLGYSLLLHSRSIVYWLGVIATIIFVRAVYKYWLIDLRVFAGVGILGYFGCSVWVKLMQGNIWPNVDNLTNSSSGIAGMLSKGFSSLMSLEAIKTFFNLFFGNLFAISQYTYCFFIIGVLLIFFLLLKKIQTKKKKNFEEVNDTILIGGVFSLISFLAMFLGLCISYVFPALHALENNQSYSGFFYLRYYYIFAVPLVLYGIMYVLNLFEQKNKRRVIIAAVFAFLGCCAFIAVFLHHVPLRDYWNTFGSKLFMDAENILGSKKYCLIYLVTVALLGLILFVARKGKLAAAIFIVVLSFYGYSYQNLYSARIWANNYVERSNDFETDILDRYDLLTTNFNIYVNESSTAYGLQLRKPQYTIYPGIPEVLEEQNQVVLCNGRNEILIKAGYMEIVLSEDEIVYFKDKDLYDLIIRDEGSKSI